MSVIVIETVQVAGRGFGAGGSVDVVFGSVCCLKMDQKGFVRGRAVPQALH